MGGKGITDALVAEVSGALELHELIKVKIAAEDREVRDAMIGELAQRAGAALVQRIGHTAVFYRPSKDHRQIVLSPALPVVGADGNVASAEMEMLSLFEKLLRANPDDSYG